MWVPALHELVRIVDAAAPPHSTVAAHIVAAPATLEVALAATDVLLMDDTAVVASDRVVRPLLRVRLREWHADGEVEWLGAALSDSARHVESAFRSLRVDYFNPTLQEWEPLVEPFALSVQYHERGTTRVLDVTTPAHAPVNVTVSTALLGLVARIRELLATLIATTRRVTFAADFPTLAQVAAPAPDLVRDPLRRRRVRLTSCDVACSCLAHRTLRSLHWSSVTKRAKLCATRCTRPRSARLRPSCCLQVPRTPVQTRSALRHSHASWRQMTRCACLAHACRHRLTVVLGREHHN